MLDLDLVSERNYRPPHRRPGPDFVGSIIVSHTAIATSICRSTNRTQMIKFDYPTRHSIVFSGDNLGLNKTIRGQLR